MKKGILAAALFSLTLTGCPFESDDDDNNYPIAAPSLNDIEGIWDMSENVPGEGFDESYVQIKANGDAVFYDYLGDEYDNYQDCYAKFESSNYFGNLTSGQFSTSSSDALFDGEVEIEQQFDISLPSKNLLDFRLSELTVSVTIPTDLQDTDVSVDYNIVYVSNLELQVEVTILDTTSSATAIRQNTNSAWQLFNVMISPAHTLMEFDSDMFDPALETELTEFSYSKYSGSESDFTPICEFGFTAAPLQKSLNNVPKSAALKSTVKQLK